MSALPFPTPTPRRKPATERAIAPELPPLAAGCRFDQFMHHALARRGWSYYSAGSRKFGPAAILSPPQK